MAWPAQDLLIDLYKISNMLPILPFENDSLCENDSDPKEEEREGFKNNLKCLHFQTKILESCLLYKSFIIKRKLLMSQKLRGCVGGFFRKWL